MQCDVMVMSCYLLCPAMGWNVMSLRCHWLCGSKWFCDHVMIQSTILCTTKYYSSTTLYYDKVLHCTLQYYSSTTPYYKVLQRTPPVQLRTTKTKYYSILQSTTPVLLCTTKYYSSTTLYYKHRTTVLSVRHAPSDEGEPRQVPTFHFTTVLSVRHARSDQRVTRLA